MCEFRTQISHILYCLCKGLYETVTVQTLLAYYISDRCADKSLIISENQWCWDTGFRLITFRFSSAVISVVGGKPMSACSSTPPPPLPKAYLHSQPTPPTPSPSPPVALYGRLSNGSHSAPSPTLSRGLDGLSFLLQIGLTRETVSLEPHDLSLNAVKDLVCSIVDQKVDIQKTFLFPIMWYRCFRDTVSLQYEKNRNYIMSKREKALIQIMIIFSFSFLFVVLTMVETWLNMYFISEHLGHHF